MVIDLTIARDKNGKILGDRSLYNPSNAVKKRLSIVLRDFESGRTIMTKPYREFNDMSLVARQREDQKQFNVYVEPKSLDPQEAWKSNAKRPIARNRIISIAAHITGSLIYPQIFAQNDQDEEDKDAAQVMRDLMEWAADQSDYSKTFLYSVIAALVNPAVIVNSEYTEKMRTIKEMKEDGSWDKKEILDEAMSGFNDAIVPLDELYIGDIYQNDIQKQPFLVWRKAIDWSVALSKYGDNEDFKKYVRPGMQHIFNADDDNFYQMEDDALQGRLVEEVIYWNRTEDLRVVVVNGVMLTDPEQPNPRKDKKYPFAKSGYELIDEGKFFYYKSLAAKMSKDAEIVDTLYKMVIDGTFLQVMPPLAIVGSEQINSAVMIPGSAHAFESEDVKINPISNGANLSQGMSMLQKVESSISESSNDVLQSGQSSPGEQTAREIRTLEQNARVMLGLFGKMIGFLVKDLGDLKVGDIVQFLTIGQVTELTNGSTRMKFPTFLLPETMQAGKKTSKRIKFQNEEEPKSKEEKFARSLKILNEEGGPQSKTKIAKVNPQLFRRLKFLLKVTPDLVTPPSDAVKKALNLELFDRAIQLPFADHQALYKDLVLSQYEETRDDPDKYVMKQQPKPQQAPPTKGRPGGGILGDIIGAEASQ